MLKRTEETRALLPELVQTDREIGDLVALALGVRSSGERPGRLACEQVHANEAEHAASPLACYVSMGDAQLVEILAETADELLVWAVTKGWAWRQA